MTVTSELRNQAIHTAAVVHPELMTGTQAAAAAEDLAMASNAVNATLMFVALRAAKTDGWKGQGHTSPADWLAAVAGVSVHEANRLLGTARKANDLDKTKEAMKNGDLSPDQADTVTDAATADPSAEDDLLGCAARDTNAKLREEAAKRKAAATDTAARERRIRRNRSLRSGTDAEGALWFRGYGPGIDAARFEAMIRPFEELVFRHHRASGRRDTYENRRYDAYFLMLAFYAQATKGAAAEADATGGTPPAPEAGADAEPGQPATPATPAATAAAASPPEPPPISPPALPPTGSPPPGPPTWSPPWDPDTSVPLPAKIPGGNNVKVIVNVDHTALLRGHTLAGETCEIAGIGPVSVQAVRQILLDDAFLAVVVRNGTDIVNVAHHGRGLNAHQRTAIEANGLHCTNIACNRTIALQIDHRIPYATDPITRLDNQDPLCSDCHRRKTHHRHHLEPGTGRRRLLPPDHPDHPHAQALDDTDTNAETADGALPSGQALLDLMDRRPLTDDEHAELEARVAANTARRQAQRQAQRVEQHTLC